MQIFSVPLGVISLVAISTNAIFTSVQFEMINNSTGVVKLGSKRNPFLNFFNGISQECWVEFWNVSGSARWSDLFQGLGQIQLGRHTQRKQIQFNKSLKTQVKPVLRPYQTLHGRRGRLGVFRFILHVNCCHSRVRTPLPDSPLWFSASVTIQKSHFQTFYCALKNTSSFPSIYIYNLSFPVLPLCCQHHISTVTVYPGSNLATATWNWVKLLYQSSLHTLYFV